MATNKTYKPVDNAQLTALKTRYTKLPSTSSRIICEPALILGIYTLIPWEFGAQCWYSMSNVWIGRDHKIISFNLKLDGSISVNYSSEDTFDTYSITINMIRVDYNVDLLRQHRLVLWLLLFVVCCLLVAVTYTQQVIQKLGRESIKQLECKECTNVFYFSWWFIQTIL